MIDDFQLSQDKKLFFASDVHLGEPDHQTSLEREKSLVRWLDHNEEQAAAFFLLGDIFDFWFEYRHVVPKGFVRLLGKLASITDRGIPIYFFTGNHDMWLHDYFPQELNIPVYSSPQSFLVNDHRFCIGHGDGLGPGEPWYKLLKKIFSNPACQWLFRWLHPNLGFALAHFWSRNSRSRNGIAQPFQSEAQEWILQHCKQLEKEGNHHDFYIFGHRHLSLSLPVTDNSRYYNIGEWIQARDYGVFDGENFEILKFD